MSDIETSINVSRKHDKDSLYDLEMSHIPRGEYSSEVKNLFHEGND